LTCSIIDLSMPIQSDECNDKKSRLVNEALETANKQRICTIAELDDIRKQYKWSKEATEDVLVSKFPNSTPAERLRFLIATDGNVPAASAKLEHYLLWRKQYDLDNVTDTKNIVTRSDDNIVDDGNDEIYWIRASALAVEFMCKNNPDMKKNVALPRILTIPNPKKLSVTSSDGTRICYFYGARIDLTLASAECYGLALSFYLDAKLDRNSMEKIFVLLDTRAGRGWSNPSASSLVSFTKDLSRILGALYPERLNMCFLFPVPSIAKFIWYLIYPFLDSFTATKVTLFTGSAGRKDPPPIDDSYFMEHFDIEVINYLEKLRKSFFVE